MLVESQESRVKTLSPHRRSPFCNLKFAICNLQSHSSHPRRALTLTEVLIAMGILTIGLLGVASLFPVASYFMLRADIEDNGSAIAQSVMNEIVTEGMLNPGAWFVMVPWNGVPVGANTTYPSDGRFAPVTQPVSVNSVRARFARPFAHTLLEALNQNATSSDPTVIGKQFGSAFVIDPMGMAALAFPDGSVPAQSAAHGPAHTFPAGAFQSWYQYSRVPNWVGSAWAPWSGGTSAGGQHGFLFPVRRVTFRQASNAWQMDKTMAEHYFRRSDDLSTELPDRDDRPVHQNWDYVENLDGSKSPLARQWTGDYSWIVTVAPTTNAARDGIARNPESHAYDVSVVVFHKRALPEDAQSAYSTYGSNLTDYYNFVGENERAVKATIVSTGLNGGEILLDAWDDPKSPFDGLKVSQWIMLCGPHPNSTMTEPRFVLNWYQVLAIDSEAAGLDPPLNPSTQRLVTVRGPQWPWTPATDLAYGNDVSNNLCAAICRGAVAVHTKTLRLENPRSSPVTFGSGGNQTTDPKRYDLSQSGPAFPGTRHEELPRFAIAER
jgi:hypothetical protein